MEHHANKKKGSKTNKFEGNTKKKKKEEKRQSIQLCCSMEKNQGCEDE